MFVIDSLHYIYIVSSTNIICLSIYIFVYVPGSVVNWVPPLLGQVQSVLDENVNLYQTLGISSHTKAHARWGHL